MARSGRRTGRCGLRISAANIGPIVADRPFADAWRGRDLAHETFGADQGVSYAVEVEGRNIALDQLYRIEVPPP